MVFYVFHVNTKYGLSVALMLATVSKREHNKAILIEENVWA